jgi:hypothetical protein
MAVLLVNALYAAQTLATFHRDRIEQTLGDAKAYHVEMARICEEDVARIKCRLGADGGSVENQVRAVQSLDMRTAQELVTTHLPMEWRAEGRAADVMLKMAQAIAQAIQAARGGSSRPDGERLPASGVV